MDVIFVFISYLLLLYMASLALIIPFYFQKKFSKKNCEGKYKIFWNIQKYFILQMKISNFINFYTTCVEVAFTLH